MKNKKKKNLNILTLSLALSTVFCCSVSFGNEIFLSEDFVPVDSSKQASEQKFPFTFTPDAFAPPSEVSSESIKIPEQEQINTVASSTIFLDSSRITPSLINIPSPSEYKRNKEKKQSSDEAGTEKAEGFSPLKDSAILQRSADERPADFVKINPSFESFVPPSPTEYKNKKEIKIKNVIVPPPSEFPSFATSEENAYYASAETEDIDFEGKTISDIKFTGLNKIDPALILKEIKTTKGTVFNEDLLQQDLQRVYNIGYFSDNMRIEPELQKDGTVELNIIVEENIVINTVNFIGNTVFTSNELAPYANQLIGKPENLNKINEVIQKINKHYENAGYILACVNSVDDNNQGYLTLGISEGIIEKIVIKGNNRTKDYVIERNILTQPGVVYNEEYIKKDIARLYSTQIFDEVDRNIEPSQDKNGQYIVTVRVKEGSSNSVSIGGGIDSALGVFGSVGYNERNFLGKGQKLSLSGMVGSGIIMSDSSIKNRMNYNIELNFVEPHFINADNSLSSKLFYRELGSYQVPLAVERRYGISSNIAHKIRGYDNLTANLGFGFEHIKLKEGDYNKISELYRKNNIDFSKRKQELRGGSFINIAPGIKYSNVDDENMPREGWIAKANFIEAFSLNNKKYTNGRLAGAITKYIPVFKKSTLSIGARGGIKVHGDHMPEVMAFRLGGPYSVRGFKMNGVGTGNSFLMASAELQTPIPLFDRFKYDVLKNMRFAFFVDAGKVFDETISSKLYDRPLGAITAGVGLRIYIPGLGPISVDYGLPLTNPGHYGSSGGYFTFGTGNIYDNY